MAYTVGVTAKTYADMLAVGLYGSAASANVEAATAAQLGISVSELSSYKPSDYEVYLLGMALGQSPLFAAEYPSTAINSNFVTAVMQNVTGSSFVMAQSMTNFLNIASQFRMTQAQLATYITTVMYRINPTDYGLDNQPNPNNPGGLSDLQTLTNQHNAALNKTVVSGYYADESQTATNLNYVIDATATPTQPGYVGAVNAESGVAFLTSSLTAATNQITVAAAANNPALIPNTPAPGEVVNIVAGTFSYAAGPNALFIANNSGGVANLNTLDTINGTGTGNELRVAVAAAATNTGATYSQITNVDRLNVLYAATSTAAFVEDYTTSSFKSVALSNLGSGIAGNALTLNGQVVSLSNSVQAAGASTVTLNTTVNTSETVNLSSVGNTRTGGNLTIAAPSLTETAITFNSIAAPSGASNNITVSNAAGNIKTVTITGSGNIAVADAANMRETTIDASGFTGNISYIANVTAGTPSSASFTYKGGSGSDVLFITGGVLGGLTSGSQLDGGAGGADELFTADVTATINTTWYNNLNATKNFEILGFNSGGAVVIDQSKITTIMHFDTIQTPATLTINNFANGTIVDQRGSGGFVVGSTGVGAVSGTININPNSFVDGVAGVGITVGVLNLSGLGNVTINSFGDQSATNTVTTFTNSINTLFNITGNNALQFSLSANGNIFGQHDQINSTLTGKLTIGTLAGNTAGSAFTQGDSWFFGSSTVGDTVTVVGSLTWVEATQQDAATLQGDTINLKAAGGSDTIVSFTGGVAANFVAPTTGAVTTVTNFQAGIDKLGFDTSAGAGALIAPTAGAVALTVGFTTNANGLVTGGVTSASNFLSILATSAVAPTAGQVYIYSDGTNTYVAETAANSATDYHVVKLAGFAATNGITLTDTGLFTVS